MDTKTEKIVQALQEQHGARLEEFRGETQLYIQPEQIIPALSFLRDQQGFELLSAQTAIDYWPQMAPRFHVIYQMTSISNKVWLQLRVPVDGNHPKLPTAAGIYDTANWRERELMDMFGIEFEGHPDPRRILMPEGTEGYPLRRDFPLGYEEPQFTFNLEDIDLRKRYAKE
ncbi:MAG: NADH-quinone oxidoreductase subunit C [Bacteroidota bacterium]